ncbi:MAG: hypothetical protein PHN38_09740 [Sulfurospirillaceae bacterium]|nr:hypothetical protein [Sulfurospirillaceae bacterium]
MQEAVDRLLMSQSSIYSWIDKGKFKIEDYPTGKLIVISSKEIEEIRELNLKSKRNKVSKQNQPKDVDLQEIPIIEAEYSRNYEEPVTNSNEFQLENGMNVSEDFAKYISELSAKAGKYELLADLQKEKEADKEFWKNKYFELQSDYEKLRDDIKSKELENIALQKQVEALESKAKPRFSPFGFLNKGK